MSENHETNLGGPRRSQLYKGIAELALLSLLEDGPQYGLVILERLRSTAKLSLAEGTIYPLLYRLERSQLVRSKWQLGKEGIRPRKYYELTRQGTVELKVMLLEWRELSANVDSFLNRK